MWPLDLGAIPLNSSTVRFRVWAPHARTVAITFADGEAGKAIPMTAQDLGYYEATVDGVRRDALYRYVLDGTKERPDPASRSQPHGVHGPSAVVDPASFSWSDQRWTGVPADRLIIYELHVGTFTTEGTFQAVMAHLPYLRDELGITAIELMPVAQFPGARNWGYDGAYPFAPQCSYGGVHGLKTLVDACHAHGLAVILDVVYNHLGPEGNYLEDFGPYFTDHYRTPWGRAINYDGPDSDEVRHYILSNAVHWVTDYHIDGLRLDAIHGIYDFSARHILAELAEAVHREGDRLGRSILVMAESDLNDVRVIAPPQEGGYGLDGQWSDDFHHALHAVLTGERGGYYEDFGRLDQLAAAFREGFVYAGQHSRHRRRRHGNSARQRPPSQLIICAQNHDQIGNRAVGDRLATLMPPDALKVAAAALLLAPQTPLLFMGEEHGETAPFLYFIDHGDPALVEAVRQGRRREFAAFGWKDVPDPQAPETFERSRVRFGTKNPEQRELLRWYAELIHLRKTIPALGSAASHDQLGVQVHPEAAALIVHRWTDHDQAALIVLGFNKDSSVVTLREPAGIWNLCLDGQSHASGASMIAIPKQLSIGPDGVTVSLPPYTAALYLS